MNAPAHDDEPMHLPVFGPEGAKCNECELENECQHERWAPGEAPKKAFNGLMIVGEGPGTHELMHKRPFVGPAGRLLDMLLENAGIDRERTYVTNATLCLPPKQKSAAKKVDERTSFTGRFPNAIPSCLPRLQQEVEAIRPKGIVTLGHAALVALTGQFHDKVKQLPNPCAHCKDARKIGPALQCATGECGWQHFFENQEDPGDEQRALLETLGGKCPRCNANIKRLRPRKVNCPQCSGRKTILKTVQEFRIEYSITESAGGLFYKDQLPQWLQDNGVEWLIATYHPSWIRRTAKEASDSDTKKFGGQFAARACWDHLAKAVKLLNGQANYDVELELSDQIADLKEYTTEHYGYDVDIETNAKSPWDVSELRCIGIGHPLRPRKLVLDTRKLFKVTVTETPDEPNRYQIEVLNPPLFDAIREFLTDPNRPKGGQNFGQYDMIVLYRFFGVYVGPIHHDVKVSHHICHPDEPHDLGHIAAELTFTPHWKAPKSQGGALKYNSFTELAEYNARDVANQGLSSEVLCGHYSPREVELPLGVKAIQWTEGGRVDDPGYRLRKGHTVSTALVPIAAEMAIKGIPLSVEVLREIERERKPAHDAQLESIREMTGRKDFSPHNNTHVAWALFDKYGPCKLTAPVVSSKTGAPSTKKDVLAKLGGQHPLVDAIREWRATQWVFSNYIYGRKLIVREDGFVHPQWNTAGPVTFRWSSEPNFQNIPDWLRKAFVAPDGWLWVGADESQLELRLIAALSGDENLIRRCRDANEKRKLEPDHDPHSYVASEFFHDSFTKLSLEIAQEKKDRDRMRYIIKSVIYAMNYGAGARKMRDTIYSKGYKGPPISVQLIEEAIKTIERVFPGIAGYRAAQIKLAKRTQEVRSFLLDRWREFPLPPPDGGVETTVACNYGIQATAADLIDLLTLIYYNRLKSVCRKAWVPAQVHDAIYTLCPEDRAEEIRKIKEDSYSTELVIVPGAPSMPFVATGKIGKSWGDVC
jgi:uracil-DNA glycosylase family 4